MTEDMITFHLVFVEWMFYFQEMGVSTGTERSRRRTEMKDIREISRSRGVDGTETEAGMDR